MTTLKSGSLFPTETVLDIFSKVKGHSSLAKLSSQTPIPFTGTEQFIFNLEGNAQIVGEGEQKKEGKATVTSKIIKPVKIIYQARVTDEFMKASDEKQLKYLESFIEGYAKKIAEAFDIAAIHGLEPKSMTDATFKATNSFDGLVTSNVLTYDTSKVEDNIDDAVAAVSANGGTVTGLALSPAAGTALSKVKVNGIAQYPEFRFGQNPDGFYGMTSDINKTLVTKGGTSKIDHIIAGDFANAFKWGYAENIPMEIIEYGDPDQTGRDLKAYNEICLRAEAYIGWGILDTDAFARVEEA
ncbi:phage capsid protein [Floricoccus tropicus]|uniref:Phage capsid protein n=1 Tax=Floricoccus tropicus TaxID=1859473 RepID=A0A1E8GMR8_9LACT|nr:phage major capsid protein [Floricoccus tropicus]OFI49530.1 phage capsid protein [Floricoccus tropicus]